ncbi:MAG: long-chain-fatty-acid--CoA ligase [Pseudomonadota bacterium]
MRIADYLEYHARLRPDSTLLVQEGVTLSYAEGLQRVYRITNALRSLGIASGDRVAVLGENSIDHVLLCFAGSLIGVATVPLNYRLAPVELQRIIADAGARLLLVADTEQQASVAAMQSQLADDVVVFTTDGVDGSRSWNALVDDQPPVGVESTQRGEACFLQLYTSGTTGIPKGVLISHDNMIALAQSSWLMYRAPATAGTMDLVVAPLFHIGGIGSAMIPILAGGGVLLHRQFDPVAVTCAIENNAVNTVFMVPAMIQAILTAVPDIAKRDFSSLRQILYGASPISEPLLRNAMAVFQCDFYQAYGMTETTGGVVFLTAEDHHRALAGTPELLQSCGRVHAGGEVKIASPDGDVLGAGETGEIAIRSRLNMAGYWNRPDETAQALRDGWMHTGDAGYIDEDGYLYIRDRIKDMVVSGGENVFPVEVEKILAGHSAIAEVAVIGIPDETYGESLLAICVLNEGRSLSDEDLILYCRDKIAGYKIPRQLKVVAALPRNPSGKILKTQLREPYWRGSQRDV